MVVEGLSLETISERLGRTYAATYHVWTKYRETLPTDAILGVRRKHQWTREDDEILLELRTSGLRYKDIQLRLPGKSVATIHERARKLGLVSMRASGTNTAVIREALQAVLDGTATLNEIVSKFPSLPPTSVRSIYN